MAIIYFDAPFFNLSSATIINRNLASWLISLGHDVRITPGKGNSAPILHGEDEPLKSIICRIEAVAHPEITIRNSWPPDMTPPPSGRLVLIQPWEFGSMPESWVDPFSKDVDEVWVPSGYVRDVYLAGGVPSNRVQIVPNGFDPEIFRPDATPLGLKTTKGFRFLFVGGAIHRKGIDFLLNAYSTIFTATDDVCLVIKDFGADSFYRKMTLRSQIVEFMSQPGVPEIEYRDADLSESDLAGLYCTCDTLVLPYRAEGFGMPVLEAMACATPPIVTDAGPSLDFCTDFNSIRIRASKRVLGEKQVFGLKTVEYPSLFRVDLDDLRMKMKWAKENKKELKKLGLAGAAYARENWTWDTAAGIADERIRKLLAKPEVNSCLEA